MWSIMKQKTILALLVLSISAPVFAMWGGGSTSPRPPSGYGPSRPADSRDSYLMKRVSDLEERVARLEMNCGGGMAPPVTVWDCTLINNFGDNFAVVAQSELLGKAQVMHECQQHAKFKLDCGEDHVKCQARQSY